MDSIKILFSFIGTFLEISLGLIFFILIRIYFEIDVIGYYAAVTSFFLVFRFIIDLGVSTAYLKFVSETKTITEEKIYTGTFLFFRVIQFLIFSIVIYILVLFSFCPKYEDNLLIFIFFFIGTMFSFINSFIFSVYLLSKKEIVKKLIATVLSLLVKILMIIIIAQYTISDIWLFTIIYCVSNFVIFLVDLFFIRKIKVKKFSREYIKKFIYFIKPLIILTSLSIIVKYLDVLMINIWFSLEEVAIFYTAKQIYTYLFIFISSINLILITTFSKNISLDNNNENLLIIRKLHKFLNLLIVPLVFIIILFITDILVYIFGENYRDTGLILSIISFKLILTSIDIANDIQLKALEEIGLYAKRYISEYLLTIFLMIIFISPIPIFILINISIYFFLSYIFKGFTIEDIRYILKIINLKNIINSISSEFK